MVMGHEAAGTVLQQGDGVKHLNVGKFLVLAVWSMWKCGKFVVDSPMVMGHEAAGTVLQLGDGVKHLNVGKFLVLAVWSMWKICCRLTHGDGS